MKQGTLTIAHRGFSGSYVENTMSAIRASLRLQVDMVEIDVHETLDGKLVAFHDYSLDRIYGIHGRLRDKNLIELKRLNPSISTLAEVLRVCRGRARVLIEIKRADPRKVAESIAKAGMQRDVIVFALSLPRMKAFAAAAPRVSRFALVAQQLPRRARQLPLSVEGIGASRLLIRSRADVERIHRCGWKLFVWTVNRRSEMERLAAWGVDGIITNYPDRAKSCLACR
jgi:glycerophosphoryl diester phosphodiesterase